MLGDERRAGEGPVPTSVLTGCDATSGWPHGPHSVSQSWKLLLPRPSASLARQQRRSSRRGPTTSASNTLTTLESGEWPHSADERRGRRPPHRGGWTRLDRRDDGRDRGRRVGPQRLRDQRESLAEEAVPPLDRRRATRSTRSSTHGTRSRICSTRPSTRASRCRCSPTPAARRRDTSGGPPTEPAPTCRISPLPVPPPSGSA